MTTKFRRCSHPMPKVALVQALSRSFSMLVKVGLDSELWKGESNAYQKFRLEGICV